MSLVRAIDADRRIHGVSGESIGSIRAATPDDLRAINAVIARAIETWPVADRVKRISLPLYQYRPDDLAYFEVLVAEDGVGDVVAVAALEPGAAVDSNADPASMTLHGIYVDPVCQRSGVGSRLLHEIETRLAARGCHGLLVKAQADATAFFAARGFVRLPVRDSARDYPYRYWKHL